jgi:hypothetical protein
MTASTTKCYRYDEGCQRSADMLIWVRHPKPGCRLALERTEHACEAHAIEDDDAGHVRRAIRVEVKA